MAARAAFGVVGAAIAASQSGAVFITVTDRRVIALIAGGLTNAEIAAQLVVSEATVKSHINHIFAKTGARDRAQAVRWAYQHGVTRP